MCRIFGTGFEFTTILGNRIQSESNGNVQIVANPRIDPFGNGGAKCLRQYAGNTVTFKPFDAETDEVYLRFGYFPAGNDASLRYELLDGATSSGVYVQRTVTTGEIVVYVAGVPRISSAAGVTPVGIYTRWELKVKIGAAAAGNVELRQDGTTIGTYGGATNDTVSKVTTMRSVWVGGDNYWDDLAVNCPYHVLYFDTVAGAAPAVGQTITGPGGITATIKAIFGNHPTAYTAGYLIIDNTGAAWADGDTIDNGAGWTAIADGPELTNQASWCGEGYVQLWYPSGVGESDLDPTSLTNSAGTKVANWSYVDDMENTADWVSGSVAGDFDVYARTAKNVLQYATINHIYMDFYQAKTDDTVPNILGHWNIATVDYPSVVIVPATSAAQWRWASEYRDPSTKAAWLIAGLNAAQAGPGVEA